MLYTQIFKGLSQYTLYVKFYPKQIEYYNKTAYGILETEIGLILPTYNNHKRNKRFIGTLLGSLASGVIGFSI